MGSQNVTSSAIGLLAATTIARQIGSIQNSEMLSPPELTTAIVVGSSC